MGLSIGAILGSASAYSEAAVNAIASGNIGAAANFARGAAQADAAYGAAIDVTKKEIARSRKAGELISA